MQGYAQDTTKAGSNSAPATGENLQAAARDHGGPISGADMAARGATNAAAAATKVPGRPVNFIAYHFIAMTGSRWRTMRTAQQQDRRP